MEDVVQLCPLAATESRRTQLDLARAVGIEGPTLVRHLDNLEQRGILKRQRGTLDRRTTQVELTRAGRARHARLLRNVIAFNEQLRVGLSADDLRTLEALLGKLRVNVIDHPATETGTQNAAGV